jgi:hypothetical protein
MASRLRTASILFLVLLLAPLAGDAQTYSVRWDAASGILPGTGCPAWVLHDNAPGNPVLAGGALTLSTSSSTSLNMYYSLSAPSIVVATPTTVDFRCRYVSGASSSTARTPIMVNFHKGANIVTALGIGADRVILLNGDLSVGSSASVDTDDSFHTYRLVNTGTSVQVYYDSNLLLSWRPTNANAGATVMIVWGEASSLPAEPRMRIRRGTTRSILV